MATVQTLLQATDERRCWVLADVIVGFYASCCWCAMKVMTKMHVSDGTRTEESADVCLDVDVSTEASLL